MALAVAVASSGRLPDKGGELLAQKRRAFARPTTAKPDALATGIQSDAFGARLQHSARPCDIGPATPSGAAPSSA